MSSFLTSSTYLPPRRNSVLEHGRIKTPWEDDLDLDLDLALPGSGGGGQLWGGGVGGAYAQPSAVAGPSSGGLLGVEAGRWRMSGGVVGGDEEADGAEEEEVAGKGAAQSGPNPVKSERAPTLDGQPHRNPHRHRSHHHSSNGKEKSGKHRPHPHPYAEDKDGSASGSGKISGRAGVRRRQKYTRTRTGCLCCRQRRIKCDEERPTCRRCKIAKKECTYPQGAEHLGGEDEEDGDGKRTRTGTGTGSDSERSQSSDEQDPVVRPEGQLSKDVGSGLIPGLDLSASSSIGAAAASDPFTSSALPASSSAPSGILDTWDASFIAGYDDVPSTSAVYPPQQQPPFDPLAAPQSTNVVATSNTMDMSALMGGATGQAGAVGQMKAQGSAPMLSTPNFLLPWFPTAEERSLILHYCANAADLMMAIPSGLNPMLAINLPLALDSPRGVNPSADALRVALLGTGAIHQAFLLARSGVSTVQTAAMFQYASNLRDTGKDMVRKAVRAPGGALTDAALGASTALATIDIFFGGGGWADNFGLAKEMVALRGGPAEMLKRSDPKRLAEGVTLSPARLMLEILAIYETFGCLTTGDEPSLLSDKWQSWWFEETQTTYEEQSVEKQFGMSRTMVHLFSRLTRLISRVTRSPLHPMILEHDITSLTSSSTLIPPAALLPSYGADPLVLEARALNDDVDEWIESLKMSTLEHERVQVGNRAYAYAMKILLLRRVFGCSRDEARVQFAATEVLKHCSTSTALLGMSIDLTWPAIIAGCCVSGASRHWLLTLLEGFKAQCCFDIETASRIIQEVWRRADANEPRADWKEVCEDLGLNVLLC